MILKLSYILSSSTPLYPGTPALNARKNRAIKSGDSANTSLITIASHSGTHIDAPSHFCPNAPSVTGILMEKNEYFPAYCLDIQKDDDECISIQDLEVFLPRFADARALLVRTGWFKHRKDEPSRYTGSGPWVDDAVPDFIRDHFPGIQIFGVDTISISSPAHREKGRACHRSFLCRERHILLLEDLDLSDPSLAGTRFTLTIFPFILDNLDGIPVQVFALTDDQDKQ